MYVEAFAIGSGSFVQLRAYSLPPLAAPIQIIADIIISKANINERLWSAVSAESLRLKERARH